MNGLTDPHYRNLSFYLLVKVTKVFIALVYGVREIARSVSARNGLDARCIKDVKVVITVAMSDA